MIDHNNSPQQFSVWK